MVSQWTFLICCCIFLTLGSTISAIVGATSKDEKTKDISFKVAIGFLVGFMLYCMVIQVIDEPQ